MKIPAGLANHLRQNYKNAATADDPTWLDNAPAGTFYLLRPFKGAFCDIRRGTQMAKALTHMRTDRTELGWLFGLAGLFFMVLVLSGCNTVEGMGEDVSAAGGAMSETADDVEDEM
jgi:entericidin B